MSKSAASPIAHVDPDLDDHLCFALYSASLAVTRLYKPLLDGLGITYPQYLALKTLNETDGQTVGGLARRLALEPSTITPLVKRLEVADLVKRSRDAEDEREVRVTLTAKGRDAVGRSTCLAEALMTRSCMDLGELGELKDKLNDFKSRLAG